MDPPSGPRSDIRLAVAPARPGVTPLDRLADAWRGAAPAAARWEPVADEDEATTDPAYGFRQLPD